MWDRLGVRGNLVIIAIAVAIASISLLTWSSARLIDGHSRGELQARGAQYQLLLNAALGAPLAQRDYATVQAILLESRQAGGIDYVAVYDTAGRLVASSGRLPTPLTAAPGHRPTGPPPARPDYDLTAPINLGGQPLGEVKFGLSGAALQRTREGLKRRIALVLIA